MPVSEIVGARVNTVSAGPVISDKRDTAISLNNATAIDIYKWSNEPAVSKAVCFLYECLVLQGGFEGNENLRKKHIRIVILNLFNTWSVDPERYISFSRGKGEYKTGRYNKLKVTYLIVAIIDALERAKYLISRKGNYSHNPEIHTSHKARMRATDKLVKLLINRFKITLDMIERHKYRECIILRDTKEIKKNGRVSYRKVDIDYEDNQAITRRRKRLIAYNDLLLNTDLSLPDAPKDGVPNKSGTKSSKLDYTDRFVRRIFNNGSWKDGGRFYGGWWQNINKCWRVRISIGGCDKGLIELDYSGFHIVLLYALKGIDYWKHIKSDPYAIKGYDATESMRDFLKLVLLISLNAGSKKKALQAITKEINFNQEEYGWIKHKGLDVEGIINSFQEVHHTIGEHFFSGYGINLQYIDSTIAEKVIDHFTRKGIPVLCIHDSFLVEHQHSSELRKVMEGSFRSVTNEYGVGGMSSVRIKENSKGGI